MVSAKVIGIHPVLASEPCHLCVVEIENDQDNVDFGDITQSVDGESRSNWQVAYDEKLLAKGKSSSTYTFFFHHLQLEKPLLSPFGPLNLPQQTELPYHLKSILYEAP